MAQINYELLLQILCLLFGPWLTYHGFRIVSSKKYYMRMMEGYIGEDIETEYNKLSKFHRIYARYRWGGGALAAGIFALAGFIWLMFFR